MVRLLLGPYGSGKTSHIINSLGRDASEKKHAFWLVPEQRTVLCESNIARLLPPSAQLYIEAVNFTRLCDKIFRTYGGLKYNYISKSSKNLIMYKTICSLRDTLDEYKIAKGREKGFIELFLDAVGELKSYCITPDVLRNAISEVENPRLKSKMHDLVSVFEVYERILGESFSDPYDDLITLADKIKAHRPFEGARVYVSSFNGFTGAQLLVLRQILFQAEDVEISLDVRESDLKSLGFSKLSETVRKIRSECLHLGKELQITSFDSDLLHKSDALAYLSKNLWHFDAPPCENHDGITLMRPRDEFDECESVASKIKELVIGGAKYSEIAVIVRNLATYRGIIDYILEKYDIPFYMSDSTVISSKPLIKLLFSAVRACASWSARDITSFIRSGYSQISDEDCDELESYMFRWDISGRKFESDDYWSANPDGYVVSPTITQMERLSKINDTRSRVLELLMPLRKAFAREATTLELCTELYSLLKALDIKSQIKAQIEISDESEAMELSQLYSAVMDALDTMCQILPSEKIGEEMFLTSLSHALEGVRIGTIPTGEDNVTVGEALSLRTENIKYSFVLGVTEGAFPATIDRGGFFSDSDKIELESVGITLSALGDERADDELFIFASAISSPSEKLYISAPQGNIKGEKLSPSIAYLRILELFPSLEGTDRVPMLPEDKIYSMKGALELSGNRTECGQAISELLGINAPELDFSNENEKISRESAREIFGSDIYLSQSKIERFASCHFDYYCTYLLSIKESEKISFGAREVGTLAHSVLEHFLTRVRDESLDISKMTDEEIEKDLDEITLAYIRALCQGGAPTAKLSHLFNRVKSNLIVYIRELAEELSQSKFVPAEFELKFSRDGIKPLKFDAGEGATITMSGVVDRVDIYRDGDTAYLRVVDYKTGDKKFNFDEFQNGLELQLLIYLFTLCKSKKSPVRDRLLGDAKELKSAGVLYFPMRLGKSRIDEEVDLSSPVASEIEAKSVADLVKRNGLFLDDERVLEAQDKEKSGKYIPKKSARTSQYFLDEQGFESLYARLCDILHGIGKSLLDGDASAVPLKLKGKSAEACEYCQHKAICRRRIK